MDAVKYLRDVKIVMCTGVTLCTAKTVLWFLKQRILISLWQKPETAIINFKAVTEEFIPA